MDLKQKLEEGQIRYNQIVESVKRLEEEKLRLINEGVKLEGRIMLLQEQMNEQNTKTNTETA